MDLEPTGVATIDLFSVDPSPKKVPKGRNTHRMVESWNAMETEEPHPETAPYNKFCESPANGLKESPPKEEPEIDPRMDMEDCMKFLHGQI